MDTMMIKRLHKDLSSLSKWLFFYINMLKLSKHGAVWHGMAVRGSVVYGKAQWNRAWLGFTKKSKIKSCSFFVSSGHAQLVYDGPKTPDKLWEDENFQFSALVRIGQSRVPRMRPIFNKWSAVVTVQFEDTLVNKARVDEWMETAGIQVGIGDWRPQYGRFDVERI